MNRARIIVLLIALAAGGLAVKFATMGDDPPPPPEAAPPIETVDILAASAPIAMGETLSPQNLSWQTLPAFAAASAELINKTNRPAAIKELSGARVRTAFAAGEPIREARLVGAGSGFLSAILPRGMRAIATDISVLENGAGGFILPGDHVDVILTRTPAGGKGDEGWSSETVLWNVLVLAIDRNLDQKASQMVPGKIATLGVTPRQAETLTLARRVGTISLVLRGFDDLAGNGDDEFSRRSSINIVRFGVSSMMQH